ncbi:MAG: hypothetical protein ACYCTB_11530 [bacterium]
MLTLKKTKSTVSDYLIIIADKIYFALTIIFIVLGALFLFGFITKFFIINQNIFKTSKSEKHQIIVLKKYLNNK